MAGYDLNEYNVIFRKSTINLRKITLLKREQINSKPSTKTEFSCLKRSLEDITMKRTTTKKPSRNKKQNRLY